MADSIALFYFCAINLLWHITQDLVVNPQLDQVITNRVRLESDDGLGAFPGESITGNEAGIK